MFDEKSRLRTMIICDSELADAQKAKEGDKATGGKEGGFIGKRVGRFGVEDADRFK